LPAGSKISTWTDLSLEIDCMAFVYSSKTQAEMSAAIAAPAREAAALLPCVLKLP
jgi:hypothetical protein